MGSQKRALSPEEGWAVPRAEELLGSLTGVLSVRVVADPGGEIEEIHVLTTDEVAPKQTVRNVESALLAHFGREVDHRKISVAQTTQTRAGEPAPSERTPPRQPTADVRPLLGVSAAAAGPRTHVAAGVGPEDRILFLGHQVEAGRSQRLRMQVAVEWQEQRFEGQAEGADLPRPRLEMVANATLRAVEAAVRPRMPARKAEDFAIQLDGVKVMDAFDRSYVLVSVNAISGRTVIPLAGTATIEDTPERAVILATLQATDRWVRGRI